MRKSSSFASFVKIQRVKSVHSFMDNNWNEDLKDQSMFFYYGELWLVMMQGF